MYNIFNYYYFKIEFNATARAGESNRRRLRKLSSKTAAVLWHTHEKIASFNEV